MSCLFLSTFVLFTGALFSFPARELGSGAFGTVYLADALGIVAFDPRGSTTKRRSSRRRFGGSVRRNHYVNNNKMTKVAVKTLKGMLRNIFCLVTIVNYDLNCF